VEHGVHLKNDIEIAVLFKCLKLKILSVINPEILIE